jgi:hypothetical protein
MPENVTEAGFFKNYMMDTVPKNKTVSVNFIRAVFSRFDFLTFS